MTFEDFISHFNVRARKGNSQVQAVCPAHDDHKASLTISRGNKGNLLHCHAGCNTEDILAAAGLTQRDLFYEDRSQDSEKWRRYVENREHRKIEAVYDYVSSLNNEYVFTKLRLEGKELRYGKITDGRFVYGVKNRKEYKAVYGNLGALRKAIEEDELVFIPEGEKDVNTLRLKGFTAITYGGANDWQTDFSELFRGAQVVVLADNDEPGKRVASQIASDLTGIAKSVKMVVPVPDTPKADVADYFERGHSTEDFLQMIVNAPAAQIIVKEKSSQGRQDKPRSSRQRSDNALVEKLIELDAAHSFSRSDKGLAELYAEVFGKQTRYCPAKRDFMFFDGVRWKLDRQGMQAAKNAKLLADALLIYAGQVDLDEDERQKYVGFVLKLQSYRNRNTIVSDSRDLNFIDAEEFDQNDYLLNVKNGVLDLSGDRPVLRSHDADLLLSRVANVVYDPDAKCPLWQQSLDQIMQGNTAKIEYLQKESGISLTGETKEEQLYIYFGSSTRNGKSTITETRVSLLGDYATTINPETLAAKNKDSRTASPDIAKLAGVRLVVAAEPPKRMLFDTALIKTMTGRDRITARQLYEAEISFLPRFKLVINSNYLPTINDDSVFKSGRIKVIEFNRHFEEAEQDKTLKDRLKDEYSGILNWMLQGYYRYKQNGLEPPQEVKEATENYRRDSDKIGKFLSECLVRSNGILSAKVVYDKYSEWCSESGYGCESKGNFFSDLRAKGVFAKSGTINGKTVKNVVRGYSFPDEGFMTVDTQEPVPFE